jgi:hypothetical protein
MRRVILIVIFINSLLIPGYTQLNSSVKIDTTITNITGDNRLNAVIPFENKGFNESGDTTGNFQGFINSTPSIKWINPSEYFNGSHFYDNMPCRKPQGDFRMRIYKPDTSYRYTLLIKKL